MKSDFKGVSYYKSKGKWCARRKGKFLGYFDDEFKAAVAYDVACIKEGNGKQPEPRKYYPSGKYDSWYIKSKNKKGEYEHFTDSFASGEEALSHFRTKMMIINADLALFHNKEFIEDLRYKVPIVKTNDRVAISVPVVGEYSFNEWGC